MFRTRPRNERSSTARGSIGSARIWDERTRALRAAGPARNGNGAATPPGAATGLPEAELEALVATLVHIALETRLDHAGPDGRAELARALEARLRVHLAGPALAPSPRETAPAPHEPAPAAVSTPDAPGTDSSGDGARDSAEVFLELDDDALEPGVRALGLVLDDRLSRLGGPLAQRADVRGRLIALALAALHPQGDAPTATRDELRDLDTLQRRLAKLERSLADTRAALEYVARLEHVDTGVASIYRYVQGLAPDDPQRERKADALDGIFRANLALQKGERERPERA